jgi:hypothetical protein
MAALIDGSQPIYVRDDLPAAETHYRAVFGFDPNGLSMAERDHHIIFQGYGATNSTFIFRIEFQRLNGQYWVRAAALTDANTWQYTPWTTLSDQPHALDLEWTASAPGQNNGALALTLDGVLTGTVTGIDNDGKIVEHVRLGPVSGVDTATSGTYFLDGFVSYR